MDKDTTIAGLERQLTELHAELATERMRRTLAETQLDEAIRVAVSASNDAERELRAAGLL